MLTNETILITGATSGFGTACARLLHKNGARIIICGRRKERLEQLSRELGNGRVTTLSFDIQDEQSIKQAIATLPAEYSKITTLINNAGVALGLQPAQTSITANWDVMIGTNINGLLYCVHSILPQMVARNSGYIINIGSVAGSYAYPGGNVYAASKAFVNHFSANLRADLFGHDIRVTSIEPGAAETEFSMVRFGGDSDKASSVYAGMTPLFAEDIAEAVLWCLTRPKHVNINKMEIMPTAQTFAPLAIARKK